MKNNKEVRDVAGQMKIGLYNQSEGRDIQIPDQNAGAATGSVRAASKTPKRKS